MAQQFRAQESLSEGSQRIFSEVLGDILEHFAHLDDDRDRRIHECRKGLKRARAYLALVEPGLERDAIRRERRALRDAGRCLASAREARVMLHVFEREVEDLNLPADEQQAARAWLEQNASEIPSSQGDHRFEEGRDLVAAALERLPVWTQTLGSWGCVAKGFAKTYRIARRRMNEAAESGKSVDFHEWRKFVKHHYYQSDLLCPAWPKKLEGRHERLDDLATTLGHAHDLLDLRKLIAKQGLGLSDFDAHLRRRCAALEADALEQGNRLFERSPSRMRKRLRTRLIEFAGAAYRGAPTNEGVVAET